MSFHPFQGRAPFGPQLPERAKPALFPWFPSLSGKSSIRTVDTSREFARIAIRRFHPFQGRAPFGLSKQTAEVKQLEVSIPFREELHSDE